jgi:hypothetical protein
MAEPWMPWQSNCNQSIPASGSSGVRAAAWPTINRPQRNRHPLIDSILRIVWLFQLSLLRLVLDNEQLLRTVSNVEVCGTTSHTASAATEAQIAP